MQMHALCSPQTKVKAYVVGVVRVELMTTSKLISQPYSLPYIKAIVLKAS